MTSFLKYTVSEQLHDIVENMGNFFLNIITRWSVLSFTLEQKLSKKYTGPTSSSDLKMYQILLLL